MRVKEKNLENKKDRNIRREIKERSKIFKSEFNEERLNELKENAHLIKWFTINDIDLMHKGEYYKNHLTLALAMYHYSRVNHKAPAYINESLINRSVFPVSFTRYSSVINNIIGLISKNSQNILVFCFFLHNWRVMEGM